MCMVERKADQYLNLNNKKQTNMAFKMKGYSAGEGTGSTMAKQEGPQTKENIDLLDEEMDGTYVYKGDKKFDRKAKAYKFPTTQNKSERIIDYEERAGFLLDNDIPDLEGSKDPKDIAKLKQLKKTAKNLQHEADIIRNRKPKK